MALPTDKEGRVCFAPFPFYYLDGTLELRTVRLTWDSDRGLTEWPPEIREPVHEPALGFDIEASAPVYHPIKMRTFRRRSICSCALGCRKCSQMLVYEEV